MTSPKCAVCGSLNLLGPTRAGDRFNISNAIAIAVELADAASPTIDEPDGPRKRFSGVSRASVCLDCGHFALFVSESLRRKLLDGTKGWRAVADEQE